VQDRLGPIEQPNSHDLAFGFCFLEDFSQQVRFHLPCGKLVILRIPNRAGRAAQVARADDVDIEKKLTHCSKFGRLKIGGVGHLSIAKPALFMHLQAHGS
jgi:hypothetical protein